MTAAGGTAVRRWTQVVDHGLLEDSDDAIVAADADGVLTAWNRGAERIYGWSADEVLGCCVTQIAQLGLGLEPDAAIRRALDAAGAGAARSWPAAGTARRSTSSAPITWFVTPTARSWATSASIAT